MEAHAFDPTSRVWIYTASRTLLTEEINRLTQMMTQFCKNWTAHNQQLFATGFIRHSRYVILMVDESQAGASGCSIDKSAHFLREAGKQLNCDFFIRNLVGIKQEGVWDWVDFKTIPALLDSGKIDGDTLVIDTAVNEYRDLDNWEKPLKATWLKRYLKESAP